MTAPGGLPRGVAAAFAVALASCAPAPPAATVDPERVAPEALIALADSARARLASLSGRGIVSFESPEMAGSGYFSVELRKPDSLLVKVDGPLGMEGVTLFLDRQRYVLYNAFENRVVIGPADLRTLRSFLPVDLSHDAVLDAFAGAVPIARGGRPLRYAMDGDRILLVLLCGGDTCAYWIDPASLLVLRHRRTDAEGRVALEVEAGRIQTLDAVAAPRRVTISLPREQRRLAIAYSSMTLNAADLSFRFSVPAGADTVSRMPP